MEFVFTTVLSTSFDQEFYLYLKILYENSTPNRYVSNNICKTFYHSIVTNHRAGTGNW